MDVEDRINSLLLSDAQVQKEFLRDGGWKLLHDWIAQSRSTHNTALFGLIVGLISKLPPASVVEMLKEANTPIITLLESIVREESEASGTTRSEAQQLCIDLLVQWHALIEETVLCPGVVEEDQGRLKLTGSSITIECEDGEITLQPTEEKIWWLMTRNGVSSFVKMKEKYWTPMKNKKVLGNQEMSPEKTVPVDQPKAVARVAPTPKESPTATPVAVAVENEKNLTTSGVNLVVTTTSDKKEDEADGIILDENESAPWKLVRIANVHESLSIRNGLFKSDEMKIQNERERNVSRRCHPRPKLYALMKSAREPGFDSYSRSSWAGSPMTRITLLDNPSYTNIFDESSTSWPEPKPEENVVINHSFYFIRKKKHPKLVDVTPEPEPMKHLCLPKKKTVPEPKKQSYQPKKKTYEDSKYKFVRIPTIPALPARSAESLPVSVAPPLPPDNPSFSAPPPPPPPPPTSPKINSCVYTPPAALAENPEVTTPSFLPQSTLPLPRFPYFRPPSSQQSASSAFLANWNNPHGQWNNRFAPGLLPTPLMSIPQPLFPPFLGQRRQAPNNNPWMSPPPFVNAQLPDHFIRGGGWRF